MATSRGKPSNFTHTGVAAVHEPHNIADRLAADFAYANHRFLD